MSNVVNKYILHNRSIKFKDDKDVANFFIKREVENQKKHKQPSTLNVKANLEKLSLDDMQVFRFNFRHQVDKKILYLHGGFNTLQPSPFHWRLLDKVALSTLYEVVMPIYPKTPEFHINDTYKAIQQVYDQLVSEVGAQNIVVMGDGSGASLALAFVQSLIERGQQVPNKLYLISPILDATLSNKEITDDLIDKDVILSQFGVNEIMKKWSDGLPLTDKKVSPIYGELTGLPPVYMFGGGREITYPDMKLFEHLMEEQHQLIHFYDYPKMVHDFPIYPIRESHKVIKQIANSIDESVIQSD
ncbi:alpha/beta hydrolase [Staphylococcus simiae]|nr:alpha/beta hydrolase [Staphylococcus simiae]